jgi:hypothetical protein
MQQQRLLVAGAFVIVLFLSSCGAAGSGVLVTESRALDPFDAIEISDGLDLRLTVDPRASTEVSVTFDDNLIDQVRTEVDGGVLIIDSTGSFNITGGGRFVTVVVTNLTSLEASGGSDAEGTGKLDTLSLEASGGADVDLSDLTVKQVSIDVSGGADVVVNPTESVVGKASGGSDVTVIGDAVTIDIETSGGADLHRS